MGITSKNALFNRSSFGNFETATRFIAQNESGSGLSFLFRVSLVLHVKRNKLKLTSNFIKRDFRIVIELRHMIYHHEEFFVEIKDLGSIPRN